MWENLIPQVTPVAFMWQLAFLRLYWLQICMEEPKTSLYLNFFMPVESKMKDMYNYICVQLPLSLLWLQRENQ